MLSTRQTKTYYQRAGVIIITIIMFLALNTTTFAQPRHKDVMPMQPRAPQEENNRAFNGPPAFWQNPAMASYLKLTKEQITALNTTVAKNGDEMKKLLDAIGKRHRDLEQAFSQRPLNLEYIKKTAASISADRTKADAMMLENRIQVATVLTEEQTKALAALMPHPQQPNPNSPK